MNKKAKRSKTINSIFNDDDDEKNDEIIVIKGKKYTVESFEKFRKKKSFNE